MALQKTVTFKGQEIINAYHKIIDLGSRKDYIVYVGKVDEVLAVEAVLSEEGEIITPAVEAVSPVAGVPTKFYNITVKVGTRVPNIEGEPENEYLYDKNYYLTGLSESELVDSGIYAKIKTYGEVIEVKETIEGVEVITTEGKTADFDGATDLI